MTGPRRRAENAPVRYFSQEVVRCRPDCRRSQPALRLPAACPPDRYIREKLTREQAAARRPATEYFRHYPKDRYDEVESWRDLQARISSSQ